VKSALRVFFVAIGALLATAVGLLWGFLKLGEDVQALRWDKPWWLVALAIVPVVMWLTTSAEDRRVPRLRVGSVGAAKSAPIGWRARLRDVPGVLRTAALVLAIVALARPQSLAAAETDERSGIDIMIVLDLSGSMRAADLKPTRLDAAKAVVQEFIERRPNDRIGAVVFAKDAYLLSPLTFDHVRIAQLFGRMTIGVISGDGTAIGDGMATALAKLRHSKAKTRVVVLLTDGDNNAGSLAPEKATQLAKEIGKCGPPDCPASCDSDKGCPGEDKCVAPDGGDTPHPGVCDRGGAKIYTVQMGNGEDVDVEIDKDAFGRPVYGRAKFPVNPELLKKIASETGGEMYIATQTEELRSSMHSILDSLTKTQFEAASSDVVERFPLALIPAVALIAVEALLRAIVLRRFP